MKGEHLGGIKWITETQQVDKAFEFAIYILDFHLQTEFWGSRKFTCASRMMIDHHPGKGYGVYMVSNELKSNIDQLSLEERASLASYLLHSLDAPDYDVSDEEVIQRVDELHSGKVQEVDHETLVKGLDLRNRV